MPLRIGRRTDDERRAYDALSWLEQERADGRHPAPAELAAELRALLPANGRRLLVPIPTKLLAYVADRLDGSERRPRGRQPASWSERMERRILGYRVMDWKRVYEHPRWAREYRRRTGRKPPRRDAYRMALRKVSDETGIPEDTLSSYVYPRR